VARDANAFVDAEDVRARIARAIPQRRPAPPPEPAPRIETESLQSEAPRRAAPERVDEHRLRASLTGLEDEVLEQAAALEALGQRIDAVEEIGKSAKKALAESAGIDARVEALGKQLRDVRGDIERLAKNLKSLSKRVGTLPEALESGVSKDLVSKELAKLAKTLRREAGELVAGIRDQLPEVGQARQVEERLDLLSKRMEEAITSRKKADDAERHQWREDASSRLARLEDAFADVARKSSRESPEASQLKVLQGRVAALEPVAAVSTELPAMGRRVKQLEEESDRVREKVGDFATHLRDHGDGKLAEGLERRLSSLEKRFAKLISELEDDAATRVRKQDKLAEQLHGAETELGRLGDHVEKNVRDELAAIVSRLDEFESAGVDSSKLDDLEGRINETLGNIVARIARAEAQGGLTEETTRATGDELRRLADELSLLKRGTAGIREDLAREGFRYFAFEDLHRGPSDVVKDRQRVLVQFFAQCRDVLDIGCGRGEFLELAAEQGIGARGIDADEDMVLHCQRKGLDVKRAEAASYLSSLGPKSLDGIVAAHVLEHMNPVEIMRLLKLAYERLKFGTYLVVETVNPLCINALATSFYLDPTHARPIHPEMLRFMLGAVGFRDSAVQFELPFETQQLPNGAAEASDLAAVLSAVRQLQHVVLGPRDYFVQALK
jgi:2-polyprenyl-3-methyl-5-hydroxy-6-metoxy-1,4-benzoquinol methylase/predicted  nucleic acid-binding Zn-ribbon protein